MYRLILAAVLLLPVLAQAQLFRWIDDSGKVHYSDRPPVSGAKNVEQKSARRSENAPPALPYALQQAVKNFPVKLYASENCKPCADARELLTKRGIPYTDVAVSDADTLEKLTGATGVPVLTVGRQAYTVFESEAYHGALDIAGYPRISLLPAGVDARQVEKPAEKPVPAASAGEAKPAADPGEASGAGAPK